MTYRNSNRNGAVASIPDSEVERRRASDVRSGSVEDHSESSKEDVIRVTPTLRIEVVNGRLKLVRIAA
jgi:hypothetical protein